MSSPDLSSRAGSVEERLPPELIDYTLGFINVGDKKTLTACTLISRAWARGAYDRRFREVTFEGKDACISQAGEEAESTPLVARTFADLADFLSTPTAILTGYVQTLQLFAEYSEPMNIVHLARILHHLPVLQRLVIACPVSCSELLPESAVSGATTVDASLRASMRKTLKTLQLRGEMRTSQLKGVLGLFSAIGHVEIGAEIRNDLGSCSSTDYGNLDDVSRRPCIDSITFRGLSDMGEAIIALLESRVVDTTPSDTGRSASSASSSGNGEQRVACPADDDVRRFTDHILPAVRTLKCVSSSDDDSAGGDGHNPRARTCWHNHEHVSPSEPTADTTSASLVPIGILLRHGTTVSELALSMGLPVAPGTMKWDARTCIARVRAIFGWAQVVYAISSSPMLRSYTLQIRVEDLFAWPLDDDKQSKSTGENLEGLKRSKRVRTLTISESLQSSQPSRSKGYLSDVIEQIAFLGWQKLADAVQGHQLLDYVDVRLCWATPSVGDPQIVLCSGEDNGEDLQEKLMRLILDRLPADILKSVRFSLDAGWVRDVRGRELAQR